MLKEQLQLIMRGLPNSHKVAEGIVKSVLLNYGKLKPEEQEEIMRRRAICETCPFMSRNAITSQEYKDLTGKHYVTERANPHCAFCGCPIPTRTAGLSSNCGIETWNNDNPTKQIELKWKQFEQ